MIRPQFVRSQVSDISLLETHVQALLRVLEERTEMATGWTDTVDLSRLFFRLTLDSATEFLFGESVNSQARSEGDEAATSSSAHAFATSFDRSQQQLSVSIRYGSLYWLGHNRRFRDDVRVCHEFIDYFVDKALRAKRDGAAAEKQGESERYVFLEAMARDTDDPVDLRSQLINVLLAGRDTTASTLAWFFFTMADPRHAHVYRRLRDVILAEFGTHSQPKRPITFEGLKNLPYLQWCINEILRLYPIVPVNSRGAVRDTVLPTGGGPDGQSPILIKKGQDVSYSVSTISHTHGKCRQNGKLSRD